MLRVGVSLHYRGHIRKVISCLTR